MYYSRDGHRELLTHNLLTDGINPTPAVTLEWNASLFRYLQEVRKSQLNVGGVGSQMGNSHGRGPQSDAFGTGTSSTLFNYGNSDMSQSSQQRFGKRTFSDSQVESRFMGDPSKRSKMGNGMMGQVGNQSEGMQQSLALGMMKFMTDNSGRQMFNTSANSQRSWQENRFQSNKPRYPSKPNSQPGRNFDPRDSTSSAKKVVHSNFQQQNNPNHPIKAAHDQSTATKPKPNKKNKKQRNIPSNPVLVEPIITPRSVKERLGNTVQDSDKSLNTSQDNYLLNQTPQSVKPSQDLLIEPLADGKERQVQVKQGSGPVKSSPLKASVPFVKRNVRPAAVSRLLSYSCRGNADDIRSMPKGLPDMLKTLVTDNEPIVSPNKDITRQDYILMMTKTSENSLNFSRIIADFDDKPNDELHSYKFGSRRIPCFRKKNHHGADLKVPVVRFIRSNQWIPGCERTTAPVTTLQKRVGEYNVALYHLMKRRQWLVETLNKSKDKSIGKTVEVHDDDDSDDEDVVVVTPKENMVIEAQSKSEEITSIKAGAEVRGKKRKRFGKVKVQDQTGNSTSADAGKDKEKVTSVIGEAQQEESDDIIEISVAPNGASVKKVKCVEESNAGEDCGEGSVTKKVTDTLNKEENCKRENVVKSASKEKGSNDQLKKYDEDWDALESNVVVIKLSDEESVDLDGDQSANKVDLNVSTTEDVKPSMCKDVGETICKKENDLTPRIGKESIDTEEEGNTADNNPIVDEDKPSEEDKLLKCNIPSKAENVIDSGVAVEQEGSCNISGENVNTNVYHAEDDADIFVAVPDIVDKEADQSPVTAPEVAVQQAITSSKDGPGDADIFVAVPDIVDDETNQSPLETAKAD